MNGFAATLRTVLSGTEIKNSTIAQAVHYDDSYVSKWLAGRVVPSERNIQRISRDIAGCIAETVDENRLPGMLQEYHAADRMALAEILGELLLAAYYGETEEAEGSDFQADDSLWQVVEDISWTGEHMVLLADLFAMEHESRLLLAGMQAGRFRERADTPQSIQVIVSLESINDPVYDPIFLVHMLTAYSHLQLRLYGSSRAQGKLLYADGQQMISAMLADEGHCLAITRMEDTKVAQRMYRNLTAMGTQETMLVRRLDMLTDDHLYMQSLLSGERSWLTGHFTEQLVPPELFGELARGDEIRIGSLLQIVAGKSRIMLYRSAFSKLMISGELDFFNRKIHLEPAQQLQCFQYVRQLAEEGCVKIVDVGFSPDFRYITDPCVFLSDTVDYLRLENGRESDNLLCITDSRLREVFHRFFGTVWSDDSREVIGTCENVLSLIDSYIAQLKLLMT